MNTLTNLLGMEDENEKENVNPNVHPYNGVVNTHSVQNTQLSRVWGQSSEYYFAAKYYEWADSEDLQLLLPTLDRGWDFKIDRNNKKIQVKRFNPIGKNHNRNSVKLRRCRTSPKRGTTCNNNYSMNSFDYLVVHDVRDDNLIVADVSECFNLDGSPKTNASVYSTCRSKGLTDLGFEVFR